MKIVVLASGEGSNFEAIVEAAKRGQLDAEVVGLLTNRSGAKVMERARRLGIPCAAIAPAEYSTAAGWNQALLRYISGWQPEWIVLAGFTGLIGPALLAAFPSRVVNSHPSLLPKFGGKGMYGMRVHEAVLRAKETETGVTVHLLNEHFDEGPIIAQERIPIDSGDTPQSLADRLKAEERKFYPRVLQDLLTGRIKTR